MSRENNVKLMTAILESWNLQKQLKDMRNRNKWWKGEVKLKKIKIFCLNLSKSIFDDFRSDCWACENILTMPMNIQGSVKVEKNVCQLGWMKRGKSRETLALLSISELFLQMRNLNPIHEIFRVLWIETKLFC